MFLVYFGIDLFGIEITGYAFVVSYLLILLFLYVVAIKVNSFKWSRNNIRLILLLTIAVSTLLMLTYFSMIGTMLLGFFLAAGATIYAIKIIAQLGIKNRKLDKVISMGKKIAHSLGFTF